MAMKEQTDDKPEQTDSEENKSQPIEIAETYDEAKERAQRLDTQLRKLMQTRRQPRYSRPKRVVEIEREQQSGPNLRQAQLERDSQLDIARQDGLREQDRKVRDEHLPSERVKQHQTKQVKHRRQPQEPADEQPKPRKRKRRDLLPSDLAEDEPKKPDRDRKRKRRRRERGIGSR